MKLCVYNDALWYLWTYIHICSELACDKRAYIFLQQLVTHIFATTHNTHTYIISNLWQTYIYLQQLMTHIHYICMWETCIHIFAATHDTCIYLQQLMTPKLKWRHVSLAVENKHWPSYPTQYNRAITPKASFTSLSLIYTLDSQSCIKYAVKSYRGN